MLRRVCFVFVAACSLQLASARSKETEVRSGPMPDIESRNEAADDSCDGLTFCSVKPADYPQDRYNQLMKGKITEPIFLPQAITEDNSTIAVGRQNGNPNYNNDCSYTVKFEPFYKVKDSQDNWRNVIQAVEENYLQVVRIELCKQNNQPCFTSFRPKNGVLPACTQVYNSWNFLVDDNNGGTETIEVRLPICCSCYYCPDC